MVTPLDMEMIETRMFKITAKWSLHYINGQITQMHLVFDNDPVPLATTTIGALHCHK